MSISTIGVDLANTSFSIHGVDNHGKPGLHRNVNRSKLLDTVAKLPPCVIGMEACSGAHYWARECQKLGYTVRIMASKYVAPYRAGAKNDLNDAQALKANCFCPFTRLVMPNDTYLGFSW